jgi:hypothetical protein
MYGQSFHPVKRPGALTKKAHAAGEGVQEFARSHEHSAGLTGQQARFAEIAKTWHHGGRKHIAPRRRG